MKSRFLIFCAVTVAMYSMASVASAAIVWNFGVEFSASGSSLSGTVVVTVENAGADTVTVKVDTTDLDGSLSEYVSGLYLNIDPAKEASLPLTVGTFDGGAVDPSLVSQNPDAFKADGDGWFDIQIDWPNQDFNAGLMDVVTFSKSGLTEDDFLFLSQNSDGTDNPDGIIAALRARSLDEDGEGSGWFYPEGFPPGGDIPEPASVVVWSLMMSLGLGVFIYRRLR